MSLAPLLNAPSVIQLHAFAAMSAGSGYHSVRFSQGHVASSHVRLGLGGAYGDSRGQLVLDTWPPDQAGRALEPDSSAVDFQPDHASTRNLVRSQASRERSPDHDDLHFHGRAGHRGTVHIRTRPHHACGCIRALNAAPKQCFPDAKNGELEWVFDDL